MRDRLRRYGSWLIALACLGWLGWQVPIGAGWAALRGAPLGLVAATYAVYFALLLLVVSLVTWVAARAALGLRLPFSEVLRLRAATYPLGLLHHAAAHAGVAYLLHRDHGVAAARGLGLGLLVAGSYAMAVLLAGAPALLAGGDERLDRLLWLALASVPAYLAIIAARPRRLAEVGLLAPLFAAGVRGHLAIVAAQLVHAALVAAGYWMILRQFGVVVPAGAAARSMPLLLLVTALPIAPAGLGTTQVAAVALFSPYAAGPDAGARAAAVAAAALAIQLLNAVCRLAAGFLGVRAAAPASAPSSATA